MHWSPHHGRKIQQLSSAEPVTPQPPSLARLIIINSLELSYTALGGWSGGQYRLEGEGDDDKQGIYNICLGGHTYDRGQCYDLGEQY